MQSITTSPASQPDPSLSKKAIAGIGWSSASKFFRQFAQLFFQIILARLLQPADFGILAMVIVITTLAEIIRSMGLGAALIQKQDAGDRHYNAAFWGNVAVGIILNILIQITAPWISAFYGQPELEKILRVYSIVFLIGSLNVVQESLMQKKLEFRRLFMMDAISITISGALALYLAFTGWGVWTLIIQYITITTISTIILWITSSWKPSFSFSSGAFRDIRAYGFNFLGYELMNFFARNIDNLLIGKYIGASALGFYSRAYFLMLQPLNITNQVLARVMFPVLARMQENKDEIKRVYLKSTSLTAFIVFPAIVFVFVCTEPVIELIFGEKWLPAAAILRVFCIYSLVDTIGITTAWLYKSLGRTDIMFRWTVFSTVITAVAIIIGLKWGALGVAISYTVAFLTILWIPGWIIAFRQIDLAVTKMLTNLFPVLLSAVLAALFIILWNHSLPLPSSLPLQVFSQLLVYVVCYLAFSWLFNRSSLLYVTNMFSVLRKKIVVKIRRR